MSTRINAVPTLRHSLSEIIIHTRLGDSQYGSPKNMSRHDQDRSQDNEHDRATKNLPGAPEISIS
ncbi:hypothetical protein F2Q69_00023247 [Brassica cretica]|uniref:Uncharacterized protein n=1 Tax=Brassica cretica TaxID=69181 RepID=A0A8S9QBF2_BRACR|nr:hypothetical protein F2Q69_00023247 [Brassica cretica]